uniref:Uncharacterized protein n=1 Tax=Vespula pensylvanica TaxID=30213 RepID=A0A834P640_VESPE|nr:hypothetical protein H0235_006093 [Vespula pensylvanica]
MGRDVKGHVNRSGTVLLFQHCTIAVVALDERRETVLKSQGLHEPFPKTEIRTTWKSVVGLEVSAKGCPERAPQSTFEPRVGFIFQKVRSVWEVRPKIAIDSPHPNGSELNRVALTCRMDGDGGGGGGGTDGGSGGGEEKEKDRSS